MPKPGGIIYAIGTQGSTMVKIGSTRTSVEKRLKILQLGEPFRLHIVARMQIDADVRQLESYVHRFLERERKRGEWFDISITGDAQLADLVVRAVQYVKEPAEQKIRTRDHGSPRLEPILLGDRIRQARDRYGMSQAELARRIGVSATALNQIESGKTSDPGVSRIIGIAAILGVSADYLLGLDTPATKRPWPRTAAPVG